MNYLEKHLVIGWILIQTIVACSALAEEKTVFSDRVKFNPPEMWEEMSKDVTDSLARYLYYVPFKPTEGTNHSANVSFVARKVPADTDTTWANQIVYSRTYSGYTVLNDCKDNEYWKSYLWRAQNNETVYVGLERIGIVNGILVQALLSFPLLGPDEGTKKVLMIDPAYNMSDQVTGVLLFFDSSLSIIADFNYLCESIDIDSTAEFNTLFDLYDLPSDNVEVLRPVPDTGKE